MPLTGACGCDVCLAGIPEVVYSDDGLHCSAAGGQLAEQAAIALATESVPLWRSSRQDSHDVQAVHER